MRTRNALPCAQNPVKPDPAEECLDQGRRSLGTVILGAIGASVGVSALGCGGSYALDAPEKRGILNTVHQAVDNIPLDACDTISDLQNVVPFPLSGSKVVLVLGYWADNDGGGGAFFWDGTSTEAPNGGTILASSLNPSVAGRWKRIYSGPLNVRWFGAKGNGSADDTSFIQKALDQFSGVRPPPPMPPGDGSDAKSGAIYFPAGQYKITSTLAYLGNRGVSLHLLGDIPDAGGSNGTDILWFGMVGGTMFHATAMNQSKWEGITFNGRSNATPPKYVVQLDSNQSTPRGVGSSGNLFIKCQFTGHAGVDSAAFVSGQIGTSWQVDDSTFINCTFATDDTLANSGTGYLNPTNPGNTKNPQFYACTFYGVDRGYSGSGVPGSKVTFSACQFLNMKRSCVQPGTGTCYLFGCAIETGYNEVKLVEGVGGFNSNPAAVVCVGNYIATSSGLTATPLVDHFGQLVLIGNYFNCGSARAQIQSLGVANSFVTSIGNQYGNGSDKVDVIDYSSNPVPSSKIISMGDVGFVPGTNAVSVLRPIHGGLIAIGGSNPTAGQAVLVSGAVTVSTLAVSAGSLIFLTRAVPGGTVGDLRIGAITPGSSFVINSSSVGDSSTVNWWVVS